MFIQVNSQITNVRLYLRPNVVSVKNISLTFAQFCSVRSFIKESIHDERFQITLIEFIQIKCSIMVKYS